MHVHNLEGVKFFEKLGLKRVVLARETSIDTIRNIKKNSNVDIEVFVHGALCISYSGCCLFSSLNGGRSGNRGECTGCCRLPYKLIENNKEIKTDGDYLLSTKELNTSKKINEILDSNITSLKIEGRMKSPEYVGFITNYYRKLIDGKPINKLDEKKLKLLFNRDFTEGYLFHNEGKNIMNIKTSNHQGIEIGKVVRKDKNNIFIKLIKDLSLNDGIRVCGKEDVGFTVIQMLHI